MEHILPKGLQFGKRSFATLGLVLAVVLVGVGAFGLGRLSALKEQRGSLKICAPQAPEPSAPARTQ